MKEIFISGLLIFSAFCLGVLVGQTNDNNYEDEYRSELESIYMLLGGMSATQRVNMNLSLKTNHYLQHEFDKDVCPDCLKHYRYLVDNMPELPEQQQQTFDMLYTKPLQKVEKIKDGNTSN